MSTSTDDARDARPGRSAAEGAERTAAIALWVVVGAALVYGISETAVRVAALFG